MRDAPSKPSSPAGRDWYQPICTHGVAPARCGCAGWCPPTSGGPHRGNRRRPYAAVRWVRRRRGLQAQHGRSTALVARCQASLSRLSHHVDWDQGTDTFLRH